MVNFIFFFKEVIFSIYWFSRLILGNISDCLFMDVYCPISPTMNFIYLRKNMMIYIYIYVLTFAMCYLYHDYLFCGPGSSVGIATGYGLDGPGIESRWGARFYAPVQTGSGAHPASCKMGTRSFPGVKSGRGVTLTPHPF